MPEQGNDTFTEIVCVIDRSGSMDSIKNDAIGGFNAFLKEQQNLPGEAAMTIVMFDHEYLVPYSGIPIQNIKPLYDGSYVPRGTTALNDAIGRAVSELKCRNPKKAIIMILTDGHENASHEFSKCQIKEMIKDCEDRGWFVAYLSATLMCDHKDIRDYRCAPASNCSGSHTVVIHHGGDCNRHHHHSCGCCCCKCCKTMIHRCCRSHRNCCACSDPCCGCRCAPYCPPYCPPPFLHYSYLWHHNVQ